MGGYEAMNDTQSTLHAGYLLRGQYRIIDLLGKGASGAVYLVTDERKPEKQFALKEVIHVIHEEQHGFPFSPAALKQLNHPALPHVYSVFYSNNHDRAYILMDYIEGSNLKVMRQLMPGKRLSLHAAMTLMSPIMDAVSYLHQQQPHIIHGDIKPSNIIAPIASASTTSKLVDLGGIRELDTNTRQSVLNYRAPEQFGKKASRRSDIYALGAVFYALLAGTVPPSAPDRMARINAGEPEQLWPISQFTPFAQIVAQAINRAMSISRHDRFASVEQFREALWQVMHTDQAAQVLELAVLGSGEEHTAPGANILQTESLELTPFIPIEEQINEEFDDSILKFPSSTPIINAQAKADPSGSSVPSIREGEPPVSASLLEETVVLRHKRPPTASSDNTPPHGKYGRRKRKTKVRFVLATIFLLVCVVWSGVAVVGYQKYNATDQNETALAKAGLKHLQTAAYLMQAWVKKPLDMPSLATARREFTMSSASFAQINTDLRPFAGVGTRIPGLGSRLSAALRLASVATEISEAGITSCDVLSLITSRFREPLGAGRGLTDADLAMLSGELREVETDVSQANAAINALKPGDLQFDSRISKAITLFHQYLPSLQALLHEADQLLPVLPALLGIGGPAFYLVEILDPAELRPGGGAIKDYGFATFIGGRLAAAHVTDVNLLDSQSAAAGSNRALPAVYKWFSPASQGWNLRDSNLDANFPTAASYAEQNYISEGGRVTLQGVIAITPTLMAQALSITGPIAIPELHETITANNVLDRLHYYLLEAESASDNVILSPGGPSTTSKYFMELLAQNFLKRVQQLPSYVLPDILQLLGKALHTKDLQIYFNASAAENLLQMSHTDAGIPPSTGDSFFLVDANTADDTANQFITGALNDQVTIDEQGNVTHRVTIRYSWSKSGTLFGSPVYSDYARVYVPPGSVLHVQQGWQPQGTNEAFKHEVWAASFNLSSGQTLTTTLGWTEKGMVKKDATGWHYQYLIQRQAGVSWAMKVTVTLPPCASKMQTTGGFTAHGRTETLSRFLYEDTNLAINYHC
jgi:serine/threonine protein kinase